MEKETGSIRFFESDDGYRIEVKGESLKKMMSCNCGCDCSPMFGLGMMRMFACCSAEGSECCSPAEKKKE